LRDPKGTEHGTIYQPEQDFFSHFIVLCSMKDEMPVYFNMPTNYTIDTDAKSIVIKISGNEEM
jgi:hypothetical protein